MEFADVVARRRMVRHFSAEPVDRVVLERIAATAQRTPSAGFSQGQRLVIVTEPERMRRVAAIAHEAEYVEMGLDPWLSECAAQFIPCVSEQVYRDRYDEPDKRPPGEDAIDWPVPYWWMDIGCTVMLILLAAVDEGLAAGFAGTHDPSRLNAELGHPGRLRAGRRHPGRAAAARQALAIAEARLARPGRIRSLGDLGHLIGLSR